MKLRLRQIEGFLALADTLSFSRAAQRIGMTQPAFSQMLRDMEDTLGLKLVDRTTRRVDLTLAAQQLVAPMHKAMADFGDIERNAAAIAHMQQGLLSLGVLPSLAGGVFMESLAWFTRRHPGIAIQVREDHNAAVIEKLTRYEVELAVCTRDDSPPALIFEELFVDELVCVMPEAHRLAGGKTVAWRQLQAETVILVSASSAINRVLRQNLLDYAQGKVAELETLNTVTALNMTRAGLGVTLIPLVALPELNMKGLTQRHMGRPRPLRSVGIYRRAGQSLSPAARLFRERLLEGLSVNGQAPRPSLPT